VCGRSGRTRGGLGPLWGSEPSTVGAELPFLRDTWRHRNRPRAGSRSGAVGPMSSQKFEDPAEGEDALVAKFKKLYDDLTAGFRNLEDEAR